MGIFDNCLLACDIDGTLMVNEQINPRNIEKIEYFMREGGAFSLSTGRTMLALNHVLAHFKHISPCVVANGSMIYDFENAKILHQDFVPREDRSIAEKIYNYDNSVGIEIHCEDKAFTLSKTPESDAHQKYEEFVAPKIDFSDAMDYNWNKAIYFFKDTEHRERVKKFIAKQKGNSNFVDTCATLNGVNYPYHEQVPVGISKLSAILKLADILEIKKGRIFAMGDYYNDLEMLKGADISAAPSDAVEDVKNCVDFIGGSCKNGAVADFIEYLADKFSKV